MYRFTYCRQYDDQASAASDWLANVTVLVTNATPAVDPADARAETIGRVRVCACVCVCVCVVYASVRMCKRVCAVTSSAPPFHISNCDIVIRTELTSL